jgi:hypothetical protein
VRGGAGIGSGTPGIVRTKIWSSSSWDIQVEDGGNKVFRSRKVGEMGIENVGGGNEQGGGGGGSGAGSRGGVAASSTRQGRHVDVDVRLALETLMSRTKTSGAFYRVAAVRDKVISG